MKKLVNGIIDFREKSLSDYREKFSRLAKGQAPDTLFVACCDSRVVPNVFVSTDPGDLFVVRNIGNLIPPFSQKIILNHDESVAAAIEFSLNTFDICDIVVCGHSDCAAMLPFLNNTFNKRLKHLNRWLRYAKASYQRYLNTPKKPDISAHNHLSQVNALQQIDHLLTYPKVQEKLAQGKLRLHAWWFDLEKADVYHYDLERKAFILIDQQEAARVLNDMENVQKSAFR